MLSALFSKNRASLKAGVPHVGIDMSQDRKQQIDSNKTGKLQSSKKSISRFVAIFTVSSNYKMTDTIHSVPNRVYARK